ncbi:MAG: hypothetical protein ACXWDA_04870 [Aeromicrobium sp.]
MRKFWRTIEALTDAAGNDGVAHLQGTPAADSLLGWARAVVKSGEIPFPNATGPAKACWSA